MYRRHRIVENPHESALRVARVVCAAHVERANRLARVYLSGYDHGLAIVRARASRSEVGVEDSSEFIEFIEIVIISRASSRARRRTRKTTVITTAGICRASPPRPRVDGRRAWTRGTGGTMMIRRMNSRRRWIGAASTLSGISVLCGGRRVGKNHR